MPPARRSGLPGQPVRGGQTAAKAPSAKRSRAGQIPASAGTQAQANGDRPTPDERAGERPARTRPRSAPDPETAKPAAPRKRPAAGSRPAAADRSAAADPTAAADRSAAAGNPAAASKRPAAASKRPATAGRGAATKPAAPIKGAAAAPRAADRPTARRSSASGSRPAAADRPAATSSAGPARRTAAGRRAVAEPAAPAGRTPAEHPAVEDAGDEALLESSAPIPSPRRRSPLFLPAVLAVVTVLLGGLAVWSGVQAHNLTGAGAGQNKALTDDAATTKIIGQVTSAVSAIFSYTYSDPGRTQRAAQRELTGKAIQQYQTVFGTMQRDAARYQQLVLTTTVTNVGVEMLQGNRARVLIFGDQVLTSASQRPQSFGAMVAMELVQQGGTWKIDDIDTFTGGR